MAEINHVLNRFTLSTVFFQVIIIIVKGQEPSFLEISSCIPNDAHGTRREVWSKLPQGKLQDLKKDPRYPNNPTTSEFLQSFEAPRGRGYMYGQKLSTYVIPPETGSYVFYMACDDECELMLSGDQDPSHAQTIIAITTWTPYRNWDYLGNVQRSAAIQMTAGRLYYAQAIMAQGRGSNHLSVGAKLPSGRYDRPLSNEYLLRYAPGAYGRTTPGEWGQWSSCSVSCGGGTQVRNRTCLDPLPIFSGIDLTMETMESRNCLPYYSCPAPPAQVIAETVNSSSIRMSWSPFYLNSSAMDLLHYNITFKRFFASRTKERMTRARIQATNTTFNHVIRGPTDVGHVLVPSSYQSAVLNGLPSYAEYCIQLATITNVWKSKPSACVNVTTAEDVPSSPPFNVTTKNFTSPHKIGVTWSPIPSGKHNGKILGYRIRVRPLITANAERTDSSEKIFTVLIPHYEAKLTGLESFTVYRIEVAAFTAIGNGPYSDPVHAETCRCPKRLYTNWWILPPLTIRSSSVNLSQIGIFPRLLLNMINVTCGLCNGHRETKIEFIKPNPKAKNISSSLKESQLEVRQDIKRTTHLSYPLSVNRGGQVSGEGFQFVPVIEVSSAVVYIQKKISGEVYAKMLGSTVFSCWPIVVLVVVLSLLAGTILCILETISYPQQITRTSTFLRGVYEYSWCAFISMTSVGYGDCFPRSKQGRIFTIMWFIVGYIVICVFVATLASSLSVKIVVLTNNPTQGGKVGVLERTVEYRIATKINGTKGTQCISYKTLEEMLSDLKESHIDGILLDALSSNNLKSTLPDNSFGVAKAFDISFSYGIGLSGDAMKLEQLLIEYIKNNPVSLEDELRKNDSEIQIQTEEKSTSAPSTKTEKNIVNFFDPSNTIYILCLHFTSGFLIGAVLCGLFYSYICNRRKRKAKDKVKLDICSKYMLLRSNKYKAELHDVLETFYRRFVCTFNTLRTKHKEERRLLLRELRHSRSEHRYHYLKPTIQHHREFKENGFQETIL